MSRLERHLLVALAHPDDESFGSAGTIVLQSRAGVPVTYVCATRGEMGRSMGRPPFANRETLPDLREAELREACRALGIRDLRLLGLWDKTVEFTEPGWIERRLLDVMREREPSLVITFHPELGGHPDHCAVGAAAVAAAQAWAGELRARGRDDLVPRVWFPVAFHEDAEAGLPVETVAIREVAEAKKAAFSAHRSQTQGWEERVAKDEKMRERFKRALIEEKFWAYPLTSRQPSAG